LRPTCRKRTLIEKVRDIIAKGQDTRELEQATGMSREQLEQFVTKFKKPPKNTPGPGREIKVSPGKDRTFRPDRQLPELNPSARVGSTARNRNSVAQDEVRDNIEGGRFEIPLELRSGYEAFKNSVSGAKSTRTSAPGSGTR